MLTDDDSAVVLPLEVTGEDELAAAVELVDSEEVLTEIKLVTDPEEDDETTVTFGISLAPRTPPLAVAAPSVDFI